MIPIKKSIVITGGASGLGEAIARLFAAKGFNVLIADINELAGKTLALELAGDQSDVLFMRCDVTETADLEKVAQTACARWKSVDIVVNNAGVATAGLIEDTPIEDWEWILNINVLGVVRGCKVFTPVFKNQGFGHFINIASAAALMTPPFMSSYNVSKSAILSLSQTLRGEFAADGIDVSVICPGFFTTNLGDSLRSPNPGLITFFEKMMAGSKLSAADIATSVHHAHRTKKFLTIPHKAERNLWLLRRFWPAKFEELIDKRFESVRKKLLD